MTSEEKIIAPVVSIPIECDLDRAIARTTARRVAEALGFKLSEQAQLGSVASNFVDLLLKTRRQHELSFNGVRAIPERVGMQIRCPVPWMTGHASDLAAEALRRQIQHPVDSVELRSDAPPVFIITLWQH